MALTVYRIVQEALTNALKHAGAGHGRGTAATSVASWLDRRGVPTPVAGRRRTAAALGHGLVGMRERVALYGGTLRTGPRPGGGFRVYARIPMDDWARRRPRAAA